MSEAASVKMPTAKRRRFSAHGLAPALCLLLSAVAASAQTTGRIDFNSTAEGPQFRMSHVGDVPRPYESGKLSPGGQPYDRLGGLAWELDITHGAPHVCGRGVPGFRHFENFMQSGPSIQAFSSFDLGLISPPGAEAIKPATKAKNWTNHTLSCDYKQDGRDASYSVTISRLTPGILVECTGPAITLFGGPQFNWVSEKSGRSYKPEQRIPAYLGAPDGPGAKIVAPENAAQLPPAGVSQWVLAWWGKRVFTSDTPDYVLTEHSYRKHWWGQSLWRDVPVLIVFESAPKRIMPGAQGGLLIEAAGDRIGKVVLMPLAGDSFLDTAGWEKGLPGNVLQAAAFWSKRLRMYPTAVEENYSYDRATDTVSVRQQTAFEPIGQGGTAFSAIPPMLALAARYGFPVKLPEGLADPGYISPVGPWVGVEGTSCTWSISGLGKYIDQRLVTAGPSDVSNDLEKELSDEVAKLVAIGQPLAPLPEVISKRASGHDVTAPWSNPGDNFYFPALVSPLLRTDQKQQLLSYVAKVGQTLPPDRSGWIPYSKGVLRTTGQAPDPETAAALDDEFKAISRADKNRLFFPAMKMVPPENCYALCAYLEAGGAWDLDGRWKQTTDNMLPYVRHMDWASLGWFRWQNNYRNADKWGIQYQSLDFGFGGVADANRWFAGTIGLTRLAQRRGDAAAEAMGRYLFARAAALRFAMGKFSRYYYDTGRVVAPADPLWYVRANDIGSKDRHQRETGGYPFALNWRGPQDDIRQVVILDEFGPSIRQTLKVYMSERLPVFNHLTPELARFLKDHLRSECATILQQTEDFIPDWEVAWGDSVLGSETSITMPENAYQIFLAKAWILDEKPQSLRQRLDIPWCKYGDYYYMAKLAATIQAYRGVEWKPATR